MSKWAFKTCQSMLGEEAPQETLKACEEKMEKKIYDDLGLEVPKEPEEEENQA